MTSIKVEIFKGIGDVKKFITKCELHCTLKGYIDEKKAVFIAERLDDAAFEAYIGLSDADKKDAEKIKEALLKHFDRAKRNREVAIEELMNRKRLPNEKAELFGNKILELVKYAYPKLNDAAIKTLTKDYYVKGLHSDLQRELRKETGFEDKSLKDLTEQTTYLEIAGINSGVTEKEVIGSIREPNNLEGKIDQLIDILGRSSAMKEEKDVEEKDGEDEKVNFAGAGSYYKSSTRGRRGGGQPPRKRLECRICNSTDHLFRRCPSRFCQSCGKKGHDGWDKNCPNYK